MKAKTKRRILHVLTKKKLVKRKTSKHILRSFLVLLATVSMGSLAYAITLNKPIINVTVHSSGPGGITIKAPVALAAAPAPQSPSGPAAMTGRGSWYALGLPQPDSLTCASRTFPRGSYLLVKNLYNSRTVICRVNDYGPEIWTGRIIDLSRGAFRAVDSLGRGTIPVELRVASGPTGLLSPTEGDIAAVVGYSLCASTHNPAYCDLHRQD
jgi:rare lipoprotein A (peptidoglycan hydrolase)